MKLHWKASMSATCLHAAACFREGLPVADDELAPTLAGAVDEFLAEIAACDLVSEDVLTTLLALASEVENNQQLVELMATKLWGRNSLDETRVNRLTGALADLEATLKRSRPKLGEELAVRSRPLREQWEGRGPGLLRQLAILTEEQLLVPQATIVLVAPIVGGHGQAHLMNNRVSFEAVLTHPNPELPETLRLAWLLSQLNLDVPVFSERLASGRLEVVAPLAMLPAVLAAAEEVELAQLDTHCLRSAIECWHLPTSLPKDVEDRLLRWWQTYMDSSTPWTVALTALDQMLCE